jgi:hypothetical protein
LRNSTRTRLGILAAAAVAAAALVQPVLAGGASAARPVPPTHPTRPTKPTEPAQVCQLISFDKAEVVQSPSGQVTLYVAGLAPSSGVTVKLVPLVYIRQPEYWGIQVIGCSSGTNLTVLTPYVAKADVTSTLGTEGIEVIGTNQSVQIPVKSTGTA